MRLITIPAVGLLCASVCAVAQEQPKPSAESEQALRDRVAQFMQFTIDRAFSKAYVLVSDDSKDWYLSSLKPQYTKFSIKDIAYSPDLQQATVTMMVTRILAMQGREMPADLTMTNLWKMADGKWMWFHDPDVLETPFGPVRMDRKAPSREGSVPKNVDPAAELKKASDLKGSVTADKGMVEFAQGTAASNEVKINNGFPGEVELDFDIVGDYGSFAVEPAHSTLAPGDDVVLKLSYKPVDRSLVSNLRVRIEPFNRTLMIPLKVTAPAAAGGSPATR